MQIWVALLSYAIFKLRSAKEGGFSMSIFLRKNALRLEKKYAEQFLNFCEVLKMSVAFLYEMVITRSQLTLVRCGFFMRDMFPGMRGSPIQGLIHIRGP